MRRVGDPIEEQHAVEVVALVLERAGGEPAPDLVVGVAVRVEVPHADVHVAVTEPRRLGTDRQPSLISTSSSSIGFDDRVDHHGQRDRRLVRVARVVAHLDHGDAPRHADLVGGDAGAVGVRASCR